MIPESSIEPVDMPSPRATSRSPTTTLPRRSARPRSSSSTAVSAPRWGWSAPSRCSCVRRGLSFLDIIARQVLHLREEYDATLPLIFMNSFRTSADTLAALAALRRPGRRGSAAGVPAEQGAQAARQGPHARSLARRTPASSGARPATATSTRRCSAPGCSTSWSTPATSACSSPTPTTSAPCRTPGWPAGSRPQARRSRSRPCGVPPPTARAATSPAASPTAGSSCGRPRRRSKEDLEALADLERHRFCSTNNLWFDLAAMKQALDVRGGMLGLPLIRNVKTVDPADKSTPEVIQVETAMGAAIEVFEDSALIEVGRDRFVPVKTTNDLHGAALRRLRHRPRLRRSTRLPRRSRSSTWTATSTSWSPSSTSGSPTARPR